MNIDFLTFWGALQFISHICAGLSISMKTFIKFSIVFLYQNIFKLKLSLLNIPFNNELGSTFKYLCCRIEYNHVSICPFNYLYIFKESFYWDSTYFIFLQNKICIYTIHILMYLLTKHSIKFTLNTYILWLMYSGWNHSEPENKSRH